MLSVPNAKWLVILEGISLGYLSSVWSVLVIVASLLASILVYSVDFPPDLMLPVFLIGIVFGVWFLFKAVAAFGVI